jgi:hypothetical protein
VEQIADVVEKMIPVMIMIYNKIVEFWVKISPYHPELLAPAVMGLVMCFFGGVYDSQEYYLSSVSDIFIFLRLIHDSDCCC